MTIALRDVSFDYSIFGLRRKSVLRDVTWEIGPGMTGLIGPNGAGKTTLISLLVGQVQPTRGTIELDSGPDEPRRPVGYLPQRFSLVPAMTVLDTVAYAAWVNGVTSGRCAAAAAAALDRVDLADYSASKVRALSGGQRQRVGLATALAHDPTILILDEPTVGLDPGHRLKLRALLSDIATNRTVLLSTHLVEDVAHLCSEVGVLAEGRLVYRGGFDDLARRTAGTSPGGHGSDFEHAYDALIHDLAGEV